MILRRFCTNIFALVSTFPYGNESGTYFSIEYDDVFFKLFITSVADPNPDPSDPYVFGPPGSGSISQQVIRDTFLTIYL
jgi:hypothetical protein